MVNFFNKFKLQTGREESSTVISNIDNGVEFRGTNLWVLIFAIFVASLGLNVNSTAVIIGAMLISPLMGPIMGIGLGIGINDVILLRKALLNYLIATGVALATSTIFFLISPLNDAHSEILARTSPNVYDVLIALFGGLAGIIAVSSKIKGNVIPGVAIATALMPPLCTAGYGLATMQLRFFVGAFYLFVINSVFIALATFIIVRILNFPFKHLQNKRSERMASRIIWSVALITLIPSLYFGYDIVKQDRFIKNANRFIAVEAHFPNDYLLNKIIDAKSRKITLVYGGKEILTQEIAHLQGELIKYNLEEVKLEIKQGFAYLNENKNNTEQAEQFNQLSKLLTEKERQHDSISVQLDSIRKQPAVASQLFAELKTQFRHLTSAVLQPVYSVSDSSKISQTYLVLLISDTNLSGPDKLKIENWLKVRLHEGDIKIIFQKNNKILCNIRTLINWLFCINSPG